MRIRNSYNATPPPVVPEPYVKAGFGFLRALGELFGGNNGPVQTSRSTNFRASSGSCCNARRQMSALQNKRTGRGR